MSVDVSVNQAGSDELNTSITLLAKLDDISNQRAWNRFVETYSPHIFEWCKKAGLQNSDASDATQEVLLKLLRLMRDFQYHPSRGSFRGWLKTITSNLVRDVMRSQQHKMRAVGNEKSWLLLINAQDEMSFRDLALMIERGYEEELLEVASIRVKNRVRENTWLSYYGTAVEGKPAPEVAVALGVSVSDVYVGKSRVIKCCDAR